MEPKQGRFESNVTESPETESSVAENRSDGSHMHVRRHFGLKRPHVRLRLGSHEIAHTEKQVVHLSFVRRHIQPQESVGTLLRVALEFLQPQP